MAKERIEFRIGSNFSGDGFKKLDKAVRSSSSTISRSSMAIGGVVDKLGEMDGSIGKVASTFGRFVSAFASMGVWGIAVAGVSALVGWFAKEAKELDEVNKKWEDRVKLIEKANAEKAAKAEQEAMQKRKQMEAKIAADAKSAQEATDKQQAEANKLYAEMADKLEKAKREEMAMGLQSDKEIVRLKTRVKLMQYAAKYEVDAAKERLKNARTRVNNGEAGMLPELGAAQANLDLALAKQKKVTLEAKNMVKEYRATVKSTEDRMRELERQEAIEQAARERRLRFEKTIAKVKEDAAKRAAEIEQRANEQKSKVAAWEEQANRARGVSFGDWSRGEREREREARTARRRYEFQAKQVNREISRLEERAAKGLFTDQQRERYRELVEWRDMQEGKNPYSEDLATIEQERKDLDKKKVDLLEKLATAMSNVGL